MKQGDLMSPIIFGYIIDEMLKKVFPEIGTNMYRMKVIVLAFADDLVLLASTEKGIQDHVDEVTEFLYQCESINLYPVLMLKSYMS